MNLYVAICLLALTASAKADGALGLEGLGGLVYAPGHASADYYSYPRYAFEYSVKDPHTGDNKAQWEKRDGDVVKGAYSLVEPDGSLRVVEYWADDKSGFNAVVKRLGPSLHPTTVHAAPIYKAPIPVLGHGPVLSPISVGPVANLGHLAGAPLISGPVHGPAVSTQSLVKESIAKPILPVPLLKAPILPAPILHEPIIKNPILSGPIYKAGPILSGPIYEPILKGPILPGPIYKGPIYPEASLGPLPIYKAPLPYINEYLPRKELPLIKESLPVYTGLPLIKGPLPLLKDLPVYKEQVPLYKEPLPALPLLKGPVELGAAEGWGLHGKGIGPWVGDRPYSSLGLESIGKIPLGSIGYGGHGGLLLEKGPLTPHLDGPLNYRY